MKQTFIEYLMLSEDVATELSQLNMRRQQLIMKKAQADKQVDVQIDALNKLIFQKERQQEAENKQKGSVPQQSVQQNQPQGNQTQQPGSTGSNTPGSGGTSITPPV